jgi:L-threonylcarbamoyladenylate synthase
MMHTKILVIDPNHVNQLLIKEAGDALKNGKLAAFPTETVYGLAAGILNQDALQRVYDVKGRPSNKPLPVQIADVDSLNYIASDIPEIGIRLIEAFFPGPLTIILNALDSVSPLITANTGKVGIRMPDHRVALELIKAAGMPIAAPSANTSGLKPPIDAQMILNDLGGKIEYIIDAGKCNLGNPSTVVDVTENSLKIVRKGAIDETVLMSVL